MHCSRKGTWKGDILVADIEELGNLGVSEIHARRLSAKEILTPKSGKNIFPIADGTAKLSEGETVESENPLCGGAHLQGVKISEKTFRES